MILDENLFEDNRGSKAGVKRGPYNTSKKQEKDILNYDKIYDDLCDLGYAVYSTGRGLTFGKREEKALNKGKEYLDKLNIEYKIDYKGYPKKYYLSFELDEKALKEPKDEVMGESTFTTQDPKGNEIRYEVEDDGTITVYEGDEVITKGKTNTESAKKIFNELGFKEIVKESIVKSIEPLDAEVAKEVDFVFASDDQNFGYKMLSRLKSDNDYILGALKDYSEDGKVSLESINKFLWFHDIDKQIAFMKGIYERLDEKPEWISLEDIDNYEKELKDIVRVEKSLTEAIADIEQVKHKLDLFPNQITVNKELSDEVKDLLQSRNISFMIDDHMNIDGKTGNRHTFFLKYPKNESLKEDLSQEDEQEYGLNTLINQLVKSEYDAIDEYNSAIVTLEAEGQGEYTDVIRSIIEDERHHIGNLQEIMNRITPGTEAEFEHGKEEAIETLDEEKPEEVERIKDIELEDSALQG